MARARTETLQGRPLRTAARSSASGSVSRDALGCGSRSRRGRRGSRCHAFEQCLLCRRGGQEFLNVLLLHLTRKSFHTDHPRGHRLGWGRLPVSHTEPADGAAVPGCETGPSPPSRLLVVETHQALAGGRGRGRRLWACGHPRVLTYPLPLLRSPCAWRVPTASSPPEEGRRGAGPAPCRPRQAGCCSRDASPFVSDASKRWHGSGPSRWETGPLTRRGPVPQGCRAGPNPEGTGQLKGPAGSVLGKRTPTAGDQPAALRRRVEPGLERRGGVSSCSDSEVRGLLVIPR